MAGPPRTPTKLKLIRGTFRKSRAPTNEPEPTPVVGIPKPPPGLPRAGQRMWKRLSAELVTQGLLTVVDLEALTVACLTYGMIWELWGGITKFRDETTGKWRRRKLTEYLAGCNSQQIPELIAMQKAVTILKPYLLEFGLTPAARARIDLPLPREPDEDPMEALLDAK